MVVRIGYQKAGTLNLLRMRGGLEATLSAQGVRVQWIGFPAGPQLLEALNAGSIDLGHTGDTPPILAQAAGVPLVYVAQEAERPHSEAIVVRPDSPIRTVGDLKGRRIALNKGSNVHYLLIRALEGAGVAYDQVHPVFLPPSDARVALEGGSVDAWATWDPYLAEVEAHAGARVVADARGLSANREFHLASRTFAESRPAVRPRDRGGRAPRGRFGAGARRGGGRAPRPGRRPGRGSDEAGGRRRTYRVEPMNEATIAEQQRIADAFAGLGLIARRIEVREAVSQPAPEAVAAGGMGRAESGHLAD